MCARVDSLPNFLHSLWAENHCLTAVYRTTSGEMIAIATHFDLRNHHSWVLSPPGPTLRCMAVKTQRDSVKQQLHRISHVPEGVRTELLSRNRAFWRRQTSGVRRLYPERCVLRSLALRCECTILQFWKLHRSMCCRQKLFDLFVHTRSSCLS